MLRKNIFLFIALLLLCGCASDINLRKARGFARESELYYQHSIKEFRRLISKSKQPDIYKFELGKIYYDHREYKLAIEEFKNIKSPESLKFLGVSLYKLGEFSDALNILKQIDNPDDECLFYLGLVSERLNLFEPALGAYKKIKSIKFLPDALGRIGVIEKKASGLNIKEKDPFVYKILANAPKQEDYPQAGALILFCEEKIETISENNQVVSMHLIVKILNQRGKEEFSETPIEYDSTYEKIELEYARTIKPDGTIAEVGSRHMRDVSKYLNFPLYSNARVYIISFPEVAEGSTIEYKVKLYRNQLINRKNFCLAYPLQSSEPIINAGFSIIVPSDYRLSIKLLNEKYNDFSADLKPRISQVNGSTSYSWEFKNIPQIIPESEMPAESEINPTMLFSTFNSWQEIYDWWWALAKDKMAVDTAIKDKVRELTKDKSSPEDKARAIYNFCAQNIRYVAVEYGQAGYEPHNAGEVLKNKYGDCKDQAVLLVTMLKEAGVPAWPVLIATRAIHDLRDDFPSMLFNHCIAAVSLKDELIFLDPTAETCSFADLPADDQNRKVLLFKEDKYEIQPTPLYPAGHNIIKQDTLVKIKSDERIWSTKSIFASGVYEQAQRYWLLYTPPELIRRQIEERIQGFSIGASLEKYEIKNLKDLNNHLTLGYDFNGPEYFINAGKLKIMPEFAGIDTSAVAQDKRRYPVDFSILDAKENTVTVELSPGFSLKHLPEDIRIENPWFKFMVEYRQKNNKIFFVQSIEAKKRVIPENEYPEFKKALEELARKLKQRIVLEVK